MCKHHFSSIIAFEFIDTELGALFFTSYQCDDCGMLLSESVNDEDIVRLPTDPPTLDKRAYWNAIQAAARRCIFEE